MQRRIVLFALTAYFFRAAAACGVEYSFMLDGTSIQPEIVSLRALSDEPRADDLVLIGDILMTMGELSKQEFRTTPEEDGRLLAVTENGVKTIGVKVGSTYQDDGIVTVNPLVQMTSDEIRQLRGIHIEEWDVRLDAKLQFIDPERTCVTIRANFDELDSQSLSRLPSTLRYLQIEEQSNTELNDYSWLSKFTNLRFLALYARTIAIDMEFLGRATGLQVLDLRGCEIRNTQALGSLLKLSVLNIAYTKGVRSLEFTGNLPSLTYLDIRHTQIRDLSPIAGNQALVTVNANQTPIETLPPGKMFALRSLKVMSTSLDDESIENFSRINPQCKVAFRLKSHLEQSLQNVTRLRVRSGGTCHRDIANETTLFEIKDPAEIATLIKRIAIDESVGGGHCMCCGEPSFEFYAGDHLTLTLGFHHGQTLRWVNEWPEDVALTSEGADFLCQWLADNGVKGPLEQQVQQKRLKESGRRRMAIYHSLIPKEIGQKLNKAQSAEDAKNAFEESIVDGKERAKLFLQLFGCGNCSWNNYSGIDQTVKEVFLPSIPMKSLTVALVETDEVNALDGAARWLFGEGNWKTVDSKDLSILLPTIGKAAVTHPRQYNRKVAIQTMGEIGNYKAKQLLRSVLNGEIEPRQLAEGEQTEPGGMFVAHPGDLDLEMTSESALAALALARIGDRECLQELRNRAAITSGHDKEIFEKAISILEKQQP